MLVGQYFSPSVIVRDYFLPSMHHQASIQCQQLSASFCIIQLQSTLVSSQQSALVSSQQLAVTICSTSSSSSLWTLLVKMQQLSKILFRLIPRIQICSGCFVWQIWLGEVLIWGRTMETFQTEPELKF